MLSYSFLNTLASITGVGGFINLGSGSGSDKEGIVIEFAEDSNVMRIGADGEGFHSLIASRGGTVKVNLLKTSPINSALSAMYHIQRTSAANWGRNTISLQNISTGDSITCEEVAFKRHADLTYASEGGMITWEFDAVKIVPVLGIGV